MSKNTFSLILIFCALIFSLKGTAQNSIDTDSTTTKPKRYTNAIIAYGYYAMNTTGIGIKYCGAFQLKKHPRVAIGPSLFIEQIQFQKNYRIPSNLVEAKINLKTPGLNVQVRCSKEICIQLGLSFLIGTEKMTKLYSFNTNPNIFGPPQYEVRPVKSSDVIGGMQFEQNFIYLPKEKTGLTFGVGIFERSLTSSIYDSDFGGKFHVGFYF